MDDATGEFKIVVSAWGRLLPLEKEVGLAFDEDNAKTMILYAITTA
ncbi:hypothetical protein [Gorillibacterium sp. sgz500922]